ncbi:MAG: serine/threonine protein kinase [Myxococcales bacterium]|nr:serine/threonine protein kinase [Myxococcales bacterium]
MLICPVCERVYPPEAHTRCPEDGALLYVLGEEGPAKRPLGVGDVIANKYKLLEELPQRGGAGRTFRAMQTALQREVELRVLPDNSITKPSDHARFQREVATWGRLRSDYIVRLYDSGFTENNAPYMALEYVRGGSLGEALRKHGPLALGTTRTVAEHTLMALQAAHQANVLHRDLTPEALVMDVRADGRPTVRLTGFGLAKHMGDEDDDPTAITMTGQVIGNPAYMAPETIMMGVLEPRTDLYGLGVTLYELLTGRRPFAEESLAAMLAAHVQGQPDPVRLHRPDIDPPLEHLIDKLLRKAPEHRFQGADEALAALRQELTQWPEPPRAVPMVVNAQGQATMMVSAIRPRRRRGPKWLRTVGLVVGGLAAALAFGGLVGWIILKLRQG